jgi:hypothetical protein
MTNDALASEERKFAALLSVFGRQEKTMKKAAVILRGWRDCYVPNVAWSMWEEKFNQLADELDPREAKAEADRP